jgi:hypothetical protein
VSAAIEIEGLSKRFGEGAVAALLAWIGAAFAVGAGLLRLRDLE